MPVLGEAIAAESNLEVTGFQDGSASRRSSAEENRRLFVSPALYGFDDGWFERGTLQWTSGANVGRKSSEIKFQRMSGNAQSARSKLWTSEAGSEVQVGDGFAIARAGCDKQFSTCQAKFANAQNFRGFPHMPGSDFVASYASREDAANDGASRNG